MITLKLNHYSKMCDASVSSRAKERASVIKKKNVFKSKTEFAELLDLLNCSDYMVTLKKCQAVM